MLLEVTMNGKCAVFDSVLACSFTIPGLISLECHDTAPVSQKANVSY